MNKDGIYEVEINNKKIYSPPDLLEFINDLAEIIKETYHNSNKSFCYKRLLILDEKFKIHLL